jgi:hypothetical protein
MTLRVRNFGLVGYDMRLSRCFGDRNTLSAFSARLYLVQVLDKRVQIIVRNVEWAYFDEKTFKQLVEIKLDERIIDIVVVVVDSK